MYENLYFPIDEELHNESIRRTHEYFAKHEEYESIDPIILISLLTDEEAIKLAKNYFFRNIEPELTDIRRFGIFEIFPHLIDKDYKYKNPDWYKNLDYTGPDLKWDKYYPAGRHIA